MTTGGWKPWRNTLLYTGLSWKILWWILHGFCSFSKTLSPNSTAVVHSMILSLLLSCFAFSPGPIPSSSPEGIFQTKLPGHKRFSEGCFLGRTQVKGYFYWISLGTQSWHYPIKMFLKLFSIIWIVLKQYFVHWFTFQL